MNCSDFEYSVQSLLDERQGNGTPVFPFLPAESRLHVNQCASCQKFVRGLDQLTVVASLWRATVPALSRSADLSALMQSVQSSPSDLQDLQRPWEALPRATITRTPHAGRNTLAKGRLLAALGAGLAMGLALLLTPPGEHPTTAVVASVSPAVESVDFPVWELREMSGLWESASDSLSVIRPAAPVWKAPVTPNLLPRSQAMVSWLGDFGQQLQPISQSMGEAVDSLWDAVDVDMVDGDETNRS